MIRQMLCAVVVLTMGVGAARGYVEPWDDGGQANHNWKTDYDQKGPWFGMFHETTGGVSGGHVWTDLDDLMRDVFPAGPAVEYSPAWLQGPDSGQVVDFTDKTLRVATKLAAGSSLNGSLHFYLGTWSNGGHFFYHQQAIVPGAEAWETTVMAVGGAGDDSAWADLRVEDESLQAYDLFDDYEEYGFILLEDTGTPTGVLRFDDFEVVPEPATLAVLGMGGLVALRRRRA